jgi:thiol:disulfide interchange protein DsbC
MKKTLCLIFCVLSLVLLSICVTSAATKKAPPKKASQKKSAKQSDCPAIHDCASCHTFSRDEAATLLKDFGEVKGVKLAPVKGLYEVIVQRGNRQTPVYVDFSKKLLIPSPIFDIALKRPVSPPPVELPVILPQADLDRIPLADSIVMGNADGKNRLFVFTDPDCPFCSKLHTELKKLVTLEPELTVYIKMFPLKMHPKAYDKARVILGSNSLEMLEKAFAHGELPPPGDKDPKEPVDATIKLGDSLGIKGTPAMIFPDGRLVSGSMSAEAILGLLKQAATKK